MTLQQLDYVIALDNHKNFVKASQQCFVTQPTITQQLQKLEDEIGFQIFDRSQSPLKATEMGELIIAKARSIMTEVEQLKEMVNNERDSIKGTFRLGIIPTIAPYIVPKFMGSFAQNYPGTLLHIETMQSDGIIKAIHKNQIDVGILATPLKEDKLREIPMYNEPFVYYGDHEDNQKTVAQADVENKEGLWLMSSGHCFGKQTLNICNSSPSRNHMNFKSGSIETLMKMVDNYGGFTLIPEMATENASKDKIMKFEHPTPIREVSLVVHKGFVKEGLIQALRKEILSVVPESFEKNERFIKVKWR